MTEETTLDGYKELSQSKLYTCVTETNEQSQVNEHRKSNKDHSENMKENHSLFSNSIVMEKKSLSSRQLRNSVQKKAQTQVPKLELTKRVRLFLYR